MRKTPIRQFTPEERVERVRQEQLNRRDNSYCHSIYDIKFDW